MHALVRIPPRNAERLLFFALIPFSLPALHAQQPSSITPGASAFAHVTPGNVSAIAKHAVETGQVPDSQPNETMMPVLERSSTEQAALDCYGEADNTPGWLRHNRTQSASSW